MFEDRRRRAEINLGSAAAYFAARRKIFQKNIYSKILHLPIRKYSQVHCKTSYQWKKAKKVRIQKMPIEIQTHKWKLTKQVDKAENRREIFSC